MTQRKYNKSEVELLRYLLMKDGKPKGATWKDLAKTFLIKPDEPLEKRRKYANDLWRRFDSKRLPAPTSEEIDPYLMDTVTNTQADGMYIVLGCVHVPFERKDAMRSIFNFCKERKDEISGLVLAGDFMDLNSLSSYDRGRLPIEGVTLGMEYERGNNVLDKFDHLLGDDITRVFIEGNHENRGDRYMSDIDNSKLKGALKSLPESLRLEARGYEYLPNWKEAEYQLGDLTITHGIYHNIHVAKKHLDTYRKSILFFHTHRQQLFASGDIVGYNGGWLGMKNSPVFSYASKAMKSNWRSGFSIVTLINGKAHVSLVSVNDDGSFVFDSKMYK